MIFVYNKKIIIEKGMFMGEFEININGIDKTAHIVIRLEVEDTGIEYVYYTVDDEKSENDDYLLFASRIEVNDDGTEEIIEIENEEEKKIAFELFSTAFKNLKI